MPYVLERFSHSEASDQSIKELKRKAILLLFLPLRVMELRFDVHAKRTARFPDSAVHVRKDSTGYSQGISPTKSKPRLFFIFFFNSHTT